MSLFVALGSNLGDSISTLAMAFSELRKHFRPIALSRIYYSRAIGYLDQPDFYNQVAEFELPSSHPKDVLKILMETETKLGRIRDIKMGPRTLDLDFLFFGDQTYHDHSLDVPHPRLWTRSFVVLPLRELPGYKALSPMDNLSQALEGDAVPLENTSTLFF